MMKGMFPSSHQLQKSQRENSFREWKCPRGLLGLAVKRLDWLHGRTALLKVCHCFSFLCFTTNSVLVLFLVLCEVSVQVFVHVCIQAKKSNRTTVRVFSNFNLLCDHCTLLPFPSAPMSLWAPGNREYYTPCLVPLCGLQTQFCLWGTSLVSDITLGRGLHALGIYHMLCSLFE